MRRQVKWSISAEDRTAAALRSLTGNLKGVDQQIFGLSSRLLGVLGLSGGIAGTVAQLSKMTSQLDALGKQARVFGQTAAELDGWYYAAERMGVSAQTFDGVLARLPAVMKQAAEGGGQAAKTFNDLGVAVTNQAGKFRPYTQVLLDVAAALEKLPSAEAKAAALAGAFPEKYKDLVRVLGQGSDAIRELLVDAAMLGDRTDDLTGAGERMADQQARLNRSLRGTGDAIWSWALPALTEFSEFLANKIPTLLTGVDEDYRRFIAGLRLAPETGLGIVEKEIASLEGTLAALEDQYEATISRMLSNPKALERGLPAMPAKIQEITNKLKLLRQERDELTRRVAVPDIVPEEAAGAVGDLADKYKDLDRILTGLVPRQEAIWQQIQLISDAEADGVISHERYAAAMAALTEQYAKLDPAAQAHERRVQRAAQILSEVETEAERYARRVAELTALHASGYLTAEQYALVLERLADTTEDIGDRGARAMEKWGDAAETVGRGVSDAVSSAVAISTDQLDGLAAHAVNVINRIMAQLAEASLVGPIANAIQSQFAGGGQTTAPDFIGPPSPTTAGKSTAGGGDKVSITIQAIDTRSGVEFLLANRSAIVGMMRDGLHRGGNAVVVR